MMRPRFNILAIALSIAMLVLHAPAARADVEADREYRIKAAFVYNFTQFVEWPADAFADDHAPFIVGVVGPDPFAGALEQVLATKVVKERPIVIRHFASVDQIGPCQLLFVPAAQDSVLAALVARTDKRPILAVGESDSFMPEGGGIRLLLEDGRMKFELNPGVLEAGRLRASAKLLKLARIYKR